MTRIEKKFAALKDAKKKGLVIYLMAGVPDAKGTIEAVKMAERAGADFIEIGLPFSDPLADGPVIQAAGIRALKTFAQATVATIATSAAISEVNWIMVVDASALAAVLSLLTSLAGLPELEK